MHVTKIVRFEWSTVFESFWYKVLERVSPITVLDVKVSRYYAVHLTTDWLARSRLTSGQAYYS